MLVQRRRQWGQQYCRAKPKGSICLLYKEADTAFAEQNKPILHDYRAIGCNYVWYNCITFYVDDGFLLRSHRV